VKLHKNANLRVLLPAIFISRTGDWIFQIALLLYIFNDSQSAFTVSLFVLTYTMPSMLLSPLITRYIIRYSGKQILIAADIVRAALITLLIVWHDSMMAIFLINALIGIVGVAFNAAYIRSVSAIFGSDKRHRINAMLNSSSYFAMIVGSLLGALLITNMTLEACLFANATSFLCSALFLVRLRNIPREETDQESTTEQLSIKQILLSISGEVKNSVVLSSVIAFGLSWGVVGGAIAVLLPVMFMSEDNSSNLLSIFYSTQAIALIAGSLIVYKIKTEKGDKILFRLFSMAYFFQAMCFACALFSQNSFISVAALFAMRLCGGIIVPLDTTLIQNNSTKQSLAFIYNVHGLIYKSCYQVSIVMIGIMIDKWDIHLTKFIVGWTSIIVISSISVVTLFWSFRDSTQSKNH
jgi:MFS family permease